MKPYCRSIVVGFLTILFFLGCSNNPPKIYEVWWLPVAAVNPVDNSVKRELILYVHVNDEEGNGDLSEIRLINHETQLFWEIDSAEWNSWDEEDELWIGSSNFTGPSTLLTEGSYKLELEDKGGRKVEYDLYLEGWPQKKEISAHSFVPQGDNGQYKITTNKQGWKLVTHSRDYSPISCPINIPFSPAELTESSEPFYGFLYYPEEMWGIKIGPYSVKSAE